MPSTSLATREDLEKKRLHDAIRRSQDEMELLIAKIETFKAKLLEVKHLYMTRIGKLYLELDKLEMDIVFYQEISALVQGGMSFSAAKKKLEEDISEKKERLQREQAQLEEEIIISEAEKDISSPDQRKIKLLYRTLIMKYHPDLTQDKAEKSRREDMMKKINLAYEQRDWQTLEQLADEQQVNDFVHASVMFLKKKLNDYFQAVESLRKDHRNLMASEWNQWRKKIEKAKREKRDAFAELALSLREMIRMKKILLSDLKNTYAP